LSESSMESGIGMPLMTRTMYIQMEFVERQTLKERIEEGITEDEAWRLFQQIVDALVHIGARGILHRDIKPTNIFIDVQGDVKVGDFGLATSSLAAVDPSDVAPHVMVFDEMTLEVGTRLYIAPEVQSRRRGPRNHSKADLYSLGIVFFEMNYMFSTGAERIAVIEDLRKSAIIFPSSWEPKRERQRKIITSLLQHSPDDRPSASELSESPLLPERVEDEYFKGSLKTMVKQDSVHHQALLSALFSEPPKTVRAFLYDAEADNHPEQASLNDVIHERLSAIFRLHGAIDMEPPLMIPLVNIEEEKGHATFIDRHGDLVFLPRDSLVPFARLAARAGHQRIKRYHISNIYKPNSVTGHPKVSKAAVFDIITPDMELGLIASGAEILTMIDELLNSFPGLSSGYEVHISHSSIVDLALQRIPIHLRSYALDIMNQTKSSPSQKRANLVKRGLPRSTADEMEILSSADEDMDNLLARIEKMSPSFFASIVGVVKEMKDTVIYAGYAGFGRSVFFRPLMLGSFYSHFKDGVLVEVVRKNKRMDILAAGGRSVVVFCLPLVYLYWNLP
jgi:translation initiation factor 2-alpha kinase 4